MLKCLNRYCKNEKKVKDAEDLYNKMCQLATTMKITPIKSNNSKSRDQRF